MAQDSTEMMMDSTQAAATMDSLQQVYDQAFENAMNSTEAQDAMGGGLMALMAMGAGFMIFMLLLVVFMVIVLWKIFTKAGQPGWAAIIPIYNYIIILKIAGKPWWWIFLMLIPVVNIVIAIMVIHNVSKSFGHGVGFTLGMLLLGIIFYPILAFGPSKYIGPGGNPAVTA